MRTVAVCNQKGGVGKTTTTFHLVRAAVVAGRKTLVVDNDPQANLSSVLGPEDVGADNVGLADVLSARAPETLSDVAVEGIWPGVTLVPAPGQTLEVVRDELVVAGPGRELRLRDALRTVDTVYDLAIIDCAPSLDQLTINGLAAADDVVIVTEPSLFSANGMARLLDTIDAVRTYYNAGLNLAGVIVNKYEKQTTGNRESMKELTESTEARGIPLLGAPMPKRAVIRDAEEASRGLDEWGGVPARVLGEMYGQYLQELEGDRR